MDQQYIEWYFKTTCEDLSNRIDSGTKYDLIVAADLLRKLLFDSTPLIHLVNKEYRYKMEFEVFKWQDSQPEKGKLEVKPILPHHDAESELIKIDTFLARTCLHYNEYAYSVKDILHHIAYTMGGVHNPSSPKDSKEKALSDELMKSMQFGIGGSQSVKIGLGLIVSIAKVTLKAIQHLIDEAEKEIGILPHQIDDFELKSSHFTGFSWLQYSKTPMFSSRKIGEFNPNDLLIESIAETEDDAINDMLLQLNIRRYIESNEKDYISIWAIPPLTQKKQNGEQVVLKIISISYQINLKKDEFYILAVLSNLGRDINAIYDGLDFIIETFYSGNADVLGTPELKTKELTYNNKLVIYTNEINSNVNQLKKKFLDRGIDISINEKKFKLKK